MNRYQSMAIVLKPNPMLKKILLVLGILFLLFIAFAVGSYFYLNESRPQGVQSAEADQLAQKMLQAVNKDAWDQTNVLQWTFADRHSFLWDKQQNAVLVTWEENKVLLNLSDLSTSTVEVGGVKQKGETRKKLTDEAWSFFCNDSFWVIAPTKVFDEGVKRSIVELEDGSKGLMVTYGSGGVTPGDSYLWILDENGLPKSYKMWVEIIPVGGLEATWADWEKMPTGVMLPKSHELTAMGMSIPITNLKAGRNLSDIGITGNPLCCFDGNKQATSQPTSQPSR